MKFGRKLTLALLSVLALVLSLSTIWTQERQFNRAFSDARQNAQTDWQQDAYDLQAALTPASDTPLTTRAWRHLMRLAGQNDQSFLAVYDESGQSMASTLPITLGQGQLSPLVPSDGPLQSCLITGTDGTRYLISSGLVVCAEECLTLVRAQSLGALFTDRTLRLQDALWGQALALVVAGILTLLFCRRMVRPLEQLEAASRQIAAGAYDRRTALAGSDEIAGLSHSFDAMAAAVEEKVHTLQTSLQAQEDFVAAFTHELKTPMTSMLGYADLLRGAEVPPATRQKAADFIYHESKRLEALSSRLMELLRLNGSAPPPLEPVRLDAVFRQLQRALPVEEPPLILPDRRVTVLAQRELLCDLLYNLVQNARHATPSDGSIRLEAEEQPDRVTLTLRDTGCGIPAEDLERITEPFYMVDKSRARQQGGSGMGLALCARIAALHGTQLSFVSAPGKGTAVSFTLRKAKEDFHEHP